MAVICSCGVPGSGKTLDTTRLAIKHYKKANNILKKIFIFTLAKFKVKKFILLRDNYFRFPYHKINNVYTNYPVLLDKKHNIYSQYSDIWDLNNDYSFEPHSLIINDELQLRVDSDEYKDKEKNKKISDIAKFLQSHRHFGIDNIILVSQHPSRIFKKARNVTERFDKHYKLFKIPFTNYSIMKIISYYNFDDYGKHIPKDREERKKLPFDYSKKTIIFNHKKVFKSYDSRYLAKYNYDKPLINKGKYNNLKIDKEKLYEIFNFT